MENLQPQQDTCGSYRQLKVSRGSRNEEFQHRPLGMLKILCMSHRPKIDEIIIIKENDSLSTYLNRFAINENVKLIA